MTKEEWSRIGAQIAHNYGELQHACNVVEKYGGIVVFPTKDK